MLCLTFDSGTILLHGLGHASARCLPGVLGPACADISRRRLAPDWEVVREPQAIAVGDALIFPDFELRQRATGERWLLEIVGYWTAEYVRRKLSALRDAGMQRLIVCIDENRRCADELLELDARVIRYRRKVDARAVLAIVEGG